MQAVHSCVCPAVLTVQRIEKEFKSRIVTMDVFVVVHSMYERVHPRIYVCLLFSLDTQPQN